jgi:threonine dehydratase
MSIKPDFNEILLAAERIRKYIHYTPVLSSKNINGIAACKLSFKCENFQKVGAFKARGATNAVMLLTEENASKGVATHSSGNFAQALAWAASNRGIKATIIMPRTAPKAKVNAVKSYNAEIIFCEPTLEARETTLRQFTESSGASFIHPYNDYNVIAGQGTAALELIKEVPEIEIIMAPVGGGGLIAGTAIAAKGISPNIEVIAAEPKNADDARRSFDAGYIIASNNPNTIADGLLTSLGDKTYPIIKALVSKIITAEEDSIINAMRLIWERMKIVIEPSAALPLAAILENPEQFKGKRIGVILSGGNLGPRQTPLGVNDDGGQVIMLAI